MIHPFLQKVLLSRKLRYTTDGGLALMDTPCMLLSMNTMVLMQKLIIDEFGKKGEDLMFKLFEVQTELAARMMVKRFGYKNINAIKMQLGHAPMVGVGNLTLLKCDIKNHEYIIRADSKFAREYKDTFGIQKGPVDHMLRGGHVAQLGTHTKNPNLVCVETKCIAMGHPHCEFVIKDIKSAKKDPRFKDAHSVRFKTDLSALMGKAGMPTRNDRAEEQS